MKKVLMLITVLFSQIFFASESALCAGIKPIESGKSNLSPAGNDTNWVMPAVDEKA